MMMKIKIKTKKTEEYKQEEQKNVQRLHRQRLPEFGWNCTNKMV